MNPFLQAAGKTVLYFALLFGAQFFIPYYILTAATVVFGLYSIWQDRRSIDGWAWLIAGAALAANDFAFRHGLWSGVVPS